MDWLRPHARSLASVALGWGWIGVLGSGAGVDLAHLNSTFKPPAYMVPTLTIPPVTTAAPAPPPMSRGESLYRRVPTRVARERVERAAGAVGADGVC